MNIYTKKGDKGKTQLLGGEMVDKFNPKIEAYGNIDELNSFIGHIYDQKINKDHKEFLIFIQIQLLNLGSIISFDGNKPSIKLPEVTDVDVKKIETEIDRLDSELDTLNNFILPSGHPISSLCQIARTVCRRAERGVVFLSSQGEDHEVAIKFMNRLSDYLFVLSRKVLKEENCPEILWK
jgi:cob(I)alamin adenosyltransferase